jgi:cellulose biosynthesis protein BcsQ
MPPWRTLTTGRCFTVIGIFNYKGGVGKTTTTMNLAVSLCKAHGRRVLIVDADPQCSTTLFFYPGQAYHRAELEAATPQVPLVDSDESEERVNVAATPAVPEEEVVVPYTAEEMQHIDKKPVTVHIQRRREQRRSEQIDPRAAETPEPNIVSALLPVFNNGSPLTDEAIKQIAAGCPRLLQHLLGDRLILLRGNSLIRKYQQQIGEATSLRHPCMRNNLGAFRALIHALAKELSVDVVLIDYGPSTDKLNEVFVMSCDYILPPCFPDEYSLSSMRSFMEALLPNWKHDLDKHVAVQRDYMKMEGNQTNDTRIAYPLCPRSPVLLSAIVTMYRRYAEHIAEVPYDFVDRLNTLVLEHMRKLRALGIRCLCLRDENNKPCGALPLYRNLHGLHGICHAMSLPVTAFRHEDVAIASERGWSVNQSEQKGSMWDVISDTIEKAKVLSGVLLKLEPPE